MSNLTGPREDPSASPRWIRILAWALLAVLFQFHVRQTVTSSVLYDDAFIATVAKNVAMGAGYASSYHTVDQFDPEISTGPAIVVPTALLIRILGNKYWVPGLAITIAIWATLFLLLGRLRRLGGRWHHLGVAVTAAGLIVFGTNEFGLLGELPAVFLAASAFALLADDSVTDVKSGIGAGAGAGTRDLREADRGDCPSCGAADPMAGTRLRARRRGEHVLEAEDRLVLCRPRAAHRGVAGLSGERALVEHRGLDGREEP